MSGTSSVRPGASADQPAPSVSQLSASTQNYLKAVWQLEEWSNDPVTPTSLSAATGLKLSSVSDAVRKLTGQGLLSHSPYGSVELTEEGRSHALAMVRRHRLIEAFLVDVLGYGWHQVHDEAEVLEHAVSDLMVDRIDALLGHPTRDPHGDPIPSASGALSIPDSVQLTVVAADCRVRIERISDTDPGLLEYFLRHGIVVGAWITTSEGAPYSESLTVQVEGSETQVSLGRSATDALFVSRAEDSPGKPR